MKIKKQTPSKSDLNNEYCIDQMPNGIKECLMDNNKRKIIEKEVSKFLNSFENWEFDQIQKEKDKLKS